MAVNLELNNVSDSDLASQLLDAQREYMALKLDHATQGIANPNEIKTARRNVARIQTEIRKRELAAMSPEEVANRSRIRFRRR
ncbi:MAG: 50S ribosomal protein L29 [Saprospiraceae bacterium]